MEVRRLLKKWLPPLIVKFIRSVREWCRDIKRFGEMRNKRKRIESKLPYPPSRLSVPKRLILFYPGSPPPDDFVAYKLCALLGYGVTSIPDRNFDVAFKRQDSTYFNPEKMSPIPEEIPVVNKESTDISKRRVNSVFEKTFKYGLQVDPHSFRGKVVAKSNLNNAHDGKVVNCPKNIEKKENIVFQKEIDNREGKGMVVDYRVPVHGDRIPLVYAKYRPFEKRFSNQNTLVRISDPGVIFEKEEINKILKFTDEMGIDYGELDVLRDKKDRKIYIVDANNTPAGPPNGLTDARKWISLIRMSGSFRDLIEAFEI